MPSIFFHFAVTKSLFGLMKNRGKGGKIYKRKNYFPFFGLEKNLEGKKNSKKVLENNV